MVEKFFLQIEDKHKNNSYIITVEDYKKLL